jgi:hypothetical protein
MQLLEIRGVLEGSTWGCQKLLGVPFFVFYCIFMTKFFKHSPRLHQYFLCDASSCRAVRNKSGILLNTILFFCSICVNFETSSRVMIICSNCDCSKNLLDTILLLLDTVGAIIFFLVNCSNPVNLWG